MPLTSLLLFWWKLILKSVGKVALFNGAVKFVALPNGALKFAALTSGALMLVVLSNGGFLMKKRKPLNIHQRYTVQTEFT